MKVEYKAIIVSFFFGFLSWGISAAIDFSFFYRDTFWNLLIYNVPPREILHRFALMNLFMIFGGVMAWLLMNRQHMVEELITSQTEIEEGRRLLEEQIFFVDRITETIPDIVSVFDMDNQVVVYTNRSITSVLGYPKEEYQEISSGIFSLLLHPEDIDHFLSQARYLNQMKNGEILDNESRWKDIDNRWRWLHTRLTTFQRHADGNVSHVLGIAQDITERKETEEALKQQVAENTRLLNQVQQRNRELEAIHQITTSLRLIQSRREMIPIFVKEVTKLLNAEVGTLALIEDGYLKFSKEFGSEIQDCSWSVEHPIIKHLIDQKEPAYLELDQYKLLDFIQTNLIEENGIFWAAQVRAGNEVIGIIFLGYHTKAKLLDVEKSLLMAIAEFAGSTLQRLDITEALETLLENRTRELAALYGVISIVSESYDLKEALNRTLAHVMEVSNSMIGSVCLFSDDSTKIDFLVCSGMSDTMQTTFEEQIIIRLAEKIIEEKEVITILDMEDTYGGDLDGFNNKHRMLCLPMQVRGVIVGILVIIKAEQILFSQEDISMLLSIADYAGLIVENARFRQGIEIAAVMEERSRLARELHDSATQYLYSASLYAEAGKALVDMQEYDQVQQYLERLTQISQQALKEMRLLVYELRPPILDQDGLIGALQQRLDAVEGRSGVQVHFEVEESMNLPPSYEEGVYRIALEALNNVLKHASATEVWVKLYFDKTKVKNLCLVVEDNGKGFDIESLDGKQGGLGLENMRERAAEFGGDFEIKSNNHHGTSVIVKVPYEPAPISGHDMGRRLIR